MTILLWHILLPIATYFIGIIVGVLIMDKIINKKIDEIFDEDDSIQHVGYTPEQMGYDK